MENPKIAQNVNGDNTSKTKSFSLHQQRHSVIGSHTPLLRKTENQLEEIKVDKKKDGGIAKKITIREVPQEDVIEEHKIESSMINMGQSFGEVAITNRKVDLIKQEE